MARETLRRTLGVLGHPAPGRVGAPFALTTHHAPRQLEARLRAQAIESGVALQIAHTRAFLSRHVDGWVDGSCDDVRHFLQAIEPLAFARPHLPQLARHAPRVVRRTHAPAGPTQHAPAEPAQRAAA